MTVALAHANAHSIRDPEDEIDALYHSEFFNHSCIRVIRRALCGSSPSRTDVVHNPVLAALNPENNPRDSQHSSAVFNHSTQAFKQAAMVSSFPAGRAPPQGLFGSAAPTQGGFGSHAASHSLAFGAPTGSSTLGSALCGAPASAPAPVFGEELAADGKKFSPEFNADEHLATAANAASCGQSALDGLIKKLSDRDARIAPLQLRFFGVTKSGVAKLGCLAVAVNESASLHGYQGFTCGDEISLNEKLSFGEQTGTSFVRKVLGRVLSLPATASKSQTLSCLASDDERTLVLLVARAIEAALLLDRFQSQSPKHESCGFGTLRSLRMSSAMRLLDQAHVPLSFALAFGRELGLADDGHSVLADLISNHSFESEDIAVTLDALQRRLLAEPVDSKRSARSTLTLVVRALEHCSTSDRPTVAAIAETQLLRQCAAALLLRDHSGEFPPSESSVDKARADRCFDAARTWRALIASHGDDDPRVVARVTRQLCEIAEAKSDAGQAYVRSQMAKNFA